MKNLKDSVVIGLWFTCLTLPILGVRVDAIEGMVRWRWSAPLLAGAAVFVLSLVWRMLLTRKESARRSETIRLFSAGRPAFPERLRRPAVAVLLGAAIFFPLAVSTYQVNIVASALIYVVLGLGLNLTVGLVGLLDLGYVAYFAIGAYAYGLLHHFFGIGFWPALPAGALAGAFFSFLIGLPILRLRGDYLAIVTLGFASILKIVLENWEEVTLGTAGIANIPRPGLFGLELDLAGTSVYIYYLLLGVAAAVAVITARLKHSRLGRAWIALREDEIAAVAMGINLARAKLSAYILSGGLGGLVGVLFATKTTFINPASFTFMDSALVLCIVVLGGMGSVTGVILGAFILVLLPEYLRIFADYRMLLFGGIMAVTMIFRPQGLVGSVRRKYELRGSGGTGAML